MSRVVIISIAFLSFCFIASCSAISGQENELKGNWTVVSFNSKETVGSNRKPYIDFLEDGKIAGSTGCNRLSGKAIQSDGSITFSNLITTKRACVGNNVMRQEQQILRALGTIVKLEREQEVVKFIDAQNNVIMTLSK